MAVVATRGRGRGRGGPRGRAYNHKRSIDSYEYDEFSSNGMDGYPKKRKIMDDVYRFLVRADLVKSIIGRGGEHIKLIKDEAKEHGIDTKVSIYAQGANGVSLMEGARDRVMSVQTTMKGLELALHHLVPSIQIHRGGRGGARQVRGMSSTQKLEVRLIVPSHCCSGIIGKGGSVIKKMKEETKSYIQVYTLPLPRSEEYCVRIQNFELADLVTTAVRVFEAIADIKGRSPVIMYDPIYFDHGEHGDTGSYIDTEWYQEALRSGVAQPTPYKALRGAVSHGGYGIGYDGLYGYDEYGYDEYWYDHYGYSGEYDDTRYYYPPPQASRRQAQPRMRGYYTTSSRGRGRSRARYNNRGGMTSPPPSDCEPMEVGETSYYEQDG